MIASIFSKQTGLFTGFQVDGPQHFIEANCPDDCDWIEGDHDHENKKVVIDDGEKKVVDYQPPAPSPHHEWNVDTKKWQIKPDVQMRRNKVNEATREIARLQDAAQRSMRELALDSENEVERKWLKKFNDQIAEQRQIIVDNS